MAELADAPDLGSGGFPCRFKSCHPHQVKRQSPRDSAVLLYKGGGLEGETVQSGLPVDVRDRGRPSAQFARESSPVTRTKKVAELLGFAAFFI